MWQFGRPARLNSNAAEGSIMSDPTPATPPQNPNEQSAPSADQPATEQASETIQQAINELAEAKSLVEKQVKKGFDDWLN